MCRKAVEGGLRLDTPIRSLRVSDTGWLQQGADKRHRDTDECEKQQHRSPIIPNRMDSREEVTPASIMTLVAIIGKN